MEHLYTTKIVRMGSSLGIVIPKQILESCTMSRGDHVLFGDFSHNGFAVRVLSDMQIKLFKQEIIKA